MSGVADTDQQEQPQDQPDADDAYLNQAAAAVHLGVHPGTIRKAISDGRLISTRVYGRVVVSQVELERYRKRYYPDGVVKRGRPGAAANAASEPDESDGEPSSSLETDG